jgi:class 3 adenylate cyclase
VHGGKVVFGEIGYRERVVKAPGHDANVAACLQDLTWDFATEVIISEMLPHG